MACRGRRRWRFRGWQVSLYRPWRQGDKRTRLVAQVPVPESGVVAAGREVVWVHAKLTLLTPPAHQFPEVPP